MVSLYDTILQHCSIWAVAYLPTLFSALSALCIAFFMGVYDRRKP